MTTGKLIFAFLCLPSVYAAKCHVCNSNADPGCGVTLDSAYFTAYATDCVSGTLGCRKTILTSSYYGDLVIRSCYNNTYANHTALRFPYYRDECTHGMNYAYTVCFCTGNLCNTTNLVATSITLLIAAVATSMLWRQFS